MIQVWTDGCCLRNPGGAGGWAFLVVDEEEIVDRGSGGEACSTKNRMEMDAVIEGLKAATELFPGQAIEVVSDSMYVVKGASEWMPKWKKRGWRRGKGYKGKMVKNHERWQQIDALLSPLVTLLWVRGHNGARFNELADFMAKEAASEYA